MDRGREEVASRRMVPAAGIDSSITQREVQNFLVEHPVGVAIRGGSMGAKLCGESSGEIQKNNPCGEGDVEVVSVAHERLGINAACAAGGGHVSRAQVPQHGGRVSRRVSRRRIA